MAKNNNLTDFLTNLATKFRSKLGLSNKINPQNFESLIDDVYSKGYSDAPSGTDVSDTTANQSDVLAGKNFYNSSGTKVAGTMSNRTGTTTGWCGYEDCTVQPHPADASQGLVTIPNSYNAPGYYDNTSSVTGNLANLNADNIKAGVVVGRSTSHGGNSSNSIVGTFTSDADASAYDIFNWKTAYVNGNKITGVYEAINIQINSGSSNCSTRTLKFDCPFEPKYLAIVFNSANYTTNRVISCYAVGTAAIVYHTRTSTGVSRTQITSGVASYWSYSNGVVTVNSPSTSYLWDNDNYRLFAFK